MNKYIVNVKLNKSSINFSVHAYNRKEAVEKVKEIMNDTTLFAFSIEDKKKLVYKVKRDVDER